jgi:acyl-coenzyme A thioesterase PaaI-like protein
MNHPFDQAIHLTPADAANTFAGATSPDYWNMVGPFGGYTAALAVRAVMQHPALLGEPVALTVNYAGATHEGPFTVTATPARTSRSTQHWVVSLSQPNTAGEPEVAMTATVMTALRRDTWHLNDMPMPPSPAPADVPRDTRTGAMAWLNRYDMRFVLGGIPQQWDGNLADVPDPSLTRLWVRDAIARPLDFASLAAMADVFYPRIWLRRPERVPAGTVSMTTYFHASSAQMRQAGTAYLLAQAQAQAFRHGFFDQTAQLWSEDGTLLATSTQLVYYKN